MGESDLFVHTVRKTIPVNAITECDDCGAHLDLLVRTQAPPVGKNEDDTDE